MSNLIIFSNLESIHKTNKNMQSYLRIVVLVVYERLFQSDQAFSISFPHRVTLIHHSETRHPPPIYTISNLKIKALKEFND